LHSHWKPDLPAVSADPDQLKQIVLNLLLNAIETSPAGGRVMLDVRDGAVLGTTAAVVMEVRDHGAGIPADQLEHIFHPFFTTKETGTGLGRSAPPAGRRSGKRPSVSGAPGWAASTARSISLASSRTLPGNA